LQDMPAWPDLETLLWIRKDSTNDLLVDEPVRHFEACVLREDDVDERFGAHRALSRRLQVCPRLVLLEPVPVFGRGSLAFLFVDHGFDRPSHGCLIVRQV
jgi:hypothetical protein